MKTLLDRLKKGEVILLDGATGTELERRGVPMEGTSWSAAAINTHPDVLRAIHEDYIRLGSTMIITNTFGTARRVLESAGLGGQFHEMNRRAVELAKEARQNAAVDRSVYIAGSISSFTAGNVKDPTLSTDRARADYREQADVLAEAGVDLLMMEMMEDLERATIAVEAAFTTGLPVWIGFSTKMGDDGSVILCESEDPLSKALDQIPHAKETVALIMHTLTEDAGPALRVLADRHPGPIGAYAHSGQFIMPNWQFIDVITPEDYASEALKWVERGAQIIGGCCGIGPEHIQALNKILPSHIPEGVN